MPLQGGEGTLAGVGKSKWEQWLAQVDLALPAYAKSLDPWPCIDKSSRPSLLKGFPLSL